MLLWTAVVLAGVMPQAPTVDLSEAERTAISERNWSELVEPVHDSPTRSFLAGWAAAQMGEPVGSPGQWASAAVPPSYRAWLDGEVLLAQGNPNGAIDAWGLVLEDTPVWPDAAFGRAAALADLNQRKEAIAILDKLLKRPDPARGSGRALKLRAELRGVDTVGGKADLRRLWARYPGSRPEVEARDVLYTVFPEFEPTFEEAVRRSEAWMNQGNWANALIVTKDWIGKVGSTSETGCRFLYTRGRSYYKQNKLSLAVKAFRDGARGCADESGGYGHKIAYLEGLAEFRRGNFEQSAKMYNLLPTLYSETTYADDGLTRKGIALWEHGDKQGALAAWEEALERFPDGDTVPEATWRLAFAQYDAGKPDEAIAAARRLGSLSLEVDPIHVAAGRYWAARWLAFPDVKDPGALRKDRLEEALEGWAALCKELPWSFYSILAYNRILKLKPELANELDGLKPAVPEFNGWDIRPEVLASEKVQAGMDLVRAGLVREGMRYLRGMNFQWTADEMAWFAETRSAVGDWLGAHGDLRLWIDRHPAGTLGDSTASVLRVAYPDHYLEEVQGATDGTLVEARLYHALIRVESAFNTDIVSHAGARGLGQLMPGTARTVAQWLDRDLTMEELHDPQTNVELGAHYFRKVMEQMHGSPYLTLAGYNAGPAKVERWAGEWGNPPTDEFLERIPYRETRKYVKRVMGAWQTMRFQFDGGGFPDLSQFVDEAMP